MIRNPSGAFAVTLAVTLAWIATSAMPCAALDLGMALARGVASHPSLVSQREATEAARHAVSPSGAWRSPMLEAGVSNLPTSGGFDRDPMTMKIIGLTQTIPLFGSNGLERGAARESWAAQSARTDRVRHQVMGAVWERYADAVFERERVREAESHQGVMQRMVEAARARYASGRGRLDDVLRVEAERARASAELAGFRASTLAAQARLTEALGGVAVEDSTPLEPMPQVSVGDRPEAWLGEVTDAHPELREAAARADANRLAAQAARRSRWPDVELHGEYGFRERLADGTDQDDMVSFTASLELPLFAGSNQGESAARMEAMAREAEADRRGVELTLTAEVRAAWATAAAEEREVLLFSDSVLVAQRRAVDASWASYGAGAGDLWRLLEANHAYYQQTLDLVSARHDLARAQARLIELTGRVERFGVAAPPRERSGP